MNIRPLIVAAALAAALPPHGAGAQGMIDLDDIVRMEVLPGWRTEEGTHMAAFRFSLAEGWKTYWRVSGAAGIPPRVNWAGSLNVGNVRHFWPRPVVFSQYGMTSIGYAGDLVLPFEVEPARASVIIISGQIQIGVCEEICIPVSMDFREVLTPSRTRPSPRILSALRDQPVAPEAAEVARVDCRITPEGDDMAISAEIDMPALGSTEFVVFELAARDTYVAEALTERDGATLTARTTVSANSGGDLDIGPEDIRITIIGGEQAVDIRGCSATG